MASNNKRVATKHIRDGIKANYRKGCSCEICGTTEDLEFHHYTTVSILLKKYAQENNIQIETDEQVLAMRDEFYQAHWYELVDYAVTLCNKHHKLLHKVYGREPPLHSAAKQEQWVLRMKGTGTDTQSSSGLFDKLLPGKVDVCNLFADLLLQEKK